MTPRPWPIPSTDGLLVQQISDLHIGYRPWSYAECEHMRDDIARGLIPPVDLKVFTGDLIDGVSADTVPTEDRYALAWLDYVIGDSDSLVAMGNHDIRNRAVHTREAWEQVYRRPANTYVDADGIRFVTFAVDTFTGNTTPWIVPDATWTWLNSVVSAASGPVVLVDHYPPSELGVTAVNYVQPAARLDELVGDNPNVIGMLCGHMHKELNDPKLANFWTIGGRSIPVVCDVSSMLSLNGGSRNISASIQSHSAYITMQEDRWLLQFRAHGTHNWSGPGGNRVTALDLANSTVTYVG